MELVEVVRTRQVEIIDERGNPRIKLYTSPNGEPIIELCNIAGKPHLELSVNNDGESGLQFWDAKGKLRFAIGIEKYGEPGFAFYDPDERIIGEFFVDQDRRSVLLQLYDAAGNRRIALEFSVLERMSGIWLYDEEGRGRVGLNLIEGVPILAFYDVAGRQRIALGFGSSMRETGLWFDDEAGRPQIVIGFNYDGEPGIWLYGESIEPPSLNP